MRASTVDPRDVEWERTPSAYRVHFWSPVDPADPRTAWSAEEWRLVGAVDVREVVSWAEAHGANRTFTLYVETVDDTGRLGCLLIAGVDPTTPGSWTMSW